MVQLANLSNVVWAYIADLSNISQYYSDISKITPAQYQYLSKVPDASLQILSQLTLTASQYTALNQLSVNPLLGFEPTDTVRLSTLYELSQPEINTLYQYVGDKTAATPSKTCF